MPKLNGSEVRVRIDYSSARYCRFENLLPGAYVEHIFSITICISRTTAKCLMIIGYGAIDQEHVDFVHG